MGPDLIHKFEAELTWILWRATGTSCNFSQFRIGHSPDDYNLVSLLHIAHTYCYQCEIGCSFSLTMGDAQCTTVHPYEKGLSTSFNTHVSLWNPHLFHIYVSHSFRGRWGTTWPGNQRSPFLCSPHGVAQFQTRPIPDVIFPSFSLSAFPSPSPYSALEDCLGKSYASNYNQHSQNQSPCIFWWKSPQTLP